MALCHKDWKNKMSVILMVKKIKLVHPEKIILVKIGEFYHVYGKDAYVIAYLMGYKLRYLEKEQVYNCGFPDKSLNKIEATLENKKISYALLDRRNNYDVDELVDYKNLNRYEEIFEKAKKYINISNRIDSINIKLMKNINNKTINKILKSIEEILNENIDTKEE